MKRNQSPAESEPLETPIWRNEPTSQYRNATDDNARENRKKGQSREEKKVDFGHDKKKKFHSEQWFQFCLT